MPRYLILSDIHANMPALETALEVAKGAYDLVVCLGDTAGYGPQPIEAVDFVRENATISILGNHDQAVIDPNLMWWFNGPAKQAVIYSKRQLKPVHYDYFRTLPHQAGEGPVVFIHSSLLELWAYVRDETEALGNLRQLAQYRRRILFTGHTHVSEVYRLKGQQVLRQPLTEGDTIDLSGEEMILINPGSIGQPRDRDTRTAFGILDTDLWIYRQHRTPYDISKVQNLMRREKLDTFLIERLDLGR